MKKIFLILCVVFVIAACKDKKVPEGAIAKVGDKYITQARFDEKAALVEDSYRKYLNTDFGKKSLLEAVIREDLIKADARGKKIAESEEYKKEIIQLEEEMQKRLASAKEELLAKMWHEQLVLSGALNVTEDEIKAYNRKYPYEVTIKAILFDDAEKAAVVLRELRASPSRVTEFAKRYSIDPAVKEKDGEVVTFMPGEFLPEIEVIASNVPTGSVQGFVKTARGFYVFVKASENRLTYNQAKDRVRRVLEQKKFDEYLGKLTEVYKVEVYEKND
ncbi:Parvulin-like peptidyl-prolyl isomerase [Parelusimicrobium proximum]|uniref:peptidylprolyl isomerase n=1 Tax=Parelusimicrobium proximum TaxID=3228953 RepID=UPI003D173950